MAANSFLYPSLRQNRIDVLVLQFTAPSLLLLLPLDPLYKVADREEGEDTFEI